MDKKDKINEIIGSLNPITKVFLILESIKNSKFKYIEIIDASNDKSIMFIKLNLDDETMIDFVDTFFDNGFKIRQISSMEFDLLQTDDIMTFNI
jgi:hypothetical protein